MARRNAPERSYEQVPQVEAPAEPLVYEKRLTIKDLFHILLRRKWIPIVCVAISVVFAGIGSFKATPIYKATAQIEIEQEVLNLLSFQDVLQVESTSVDYYNTQYKILRSRSLAEKVATELRAARNPRDANLTRNAILGMIKIEPVKDSRLVDITAESQFPQQAARVANALTRAYIDQDLNKKVESVRLAAEKLREELTTAKRRADESEKRFTAYKEQNNIVSLNEKQNLVLEELSKLNQDAAAARTERLKKEARFNELKQMSLEQLRHVEEVVNNEQIQEVKKRQEFDALENVKRLAKSYTDMHPDMIQAKKKLASVQQTVDDLIPKVVEEAEKSFEKAKTQEERLVQAVEKKKQEVLEFNRRVNLYGSLSREVETNKTLYDEILNRSRETDISERTEKSNVRVVDKADVPTRPFKPRTGRNLIIAFVAGLIVGCGGAFFVEHLNDKVENPEDIQGFLAKPFLGAVPEISDTYDGTGERARIAHLSPESSVSEAYKTLLAGIHYSPAAQGIRTILVTSAGPAEGKTTTVTNLGIAAAQNGKKVLLVDSDLRKPAIHEVFGLAKDAGFTDYLIGEADLGQIVQETDIPNLSVIARGTSSPNPSGLISSERMKEFAKLIKDKFDLILFDSPPCTVVADPLTLANVVDAVVNVTQSGRYSRKLVGRGLDLLDGVNANVLGVVLNEVKERDHRYYYHGYSYYYGKDGDRKGKTRKARREKSSRTQEQKNSAPKLAS